MTFGTRTKVSVMPSKELKIGNTTINRVQEFKYLGVKLDSCLTFNNHVQYIQSKTIGKMKLLPGSHLFCQINYVSRCIKH